MAGEAGSFRLGNTDAPPGGAESGQVGPRGVYGFFVLMGTGFFVLNLSLSFSSHSQLRSDRAVDGALSISSPLSFPEASESVEPLLRLLLLLSVLPVVLVRFRIAFPVCGGDARLGETSAMLFRKSK